MKLLFVLIFSYQIFSQITHFEKSNYLETVKPENTLDFYKEIQKKSPYISIQKTGESDGNYPLHNIILSKQKHFKPNQKKNEIVMLVNNGIHPGESDGIDAAQLFTRYILEKMKTSKEFDQVIFVIIPVYNIGGQNNRSAFKRVNQNGPLEMGFRGNERNFDLNRDFIKTDTKNMAFFAETFHSWDTDLFIDDHVTNGADYQAVMTYTVNETVHVSEPMRSFVKNNLKSAIDEGFKKNGIIVAGYTESKVNGDLKKGIDYFHATPRYGTGYTELFNALTILSETHMLKPYKERVYSNYELLKILAHFSANNLEQIINIKRLTNLNVSKLTNYTLRYRKDESRADTILFPGFDYSQVFNKYANTTLESYDRSRPQIWKMPVFSYYIPTDSLTVPKAYIIPQQWTDVIERLKLNKVEFSVLKEDKSYEVVQTRLANPKFATNAYEGHIMLNSFDQTQEKLTKMYRAGDILVYCNQKKNKYIFEALEPICGDSFLRWGFFNSIFQQKEYFSMYTFSEKIEKMINENPNLEKEFNDWCESNPDAAKNPYMRFSFFYTRSPYYEKSTHMVYPIARIY
jgi:hypothetical protein